MLPGTQIIGGTYGARKILNFCFSYKQVAPAGAKSQFPYNHLNIFYHICVNTVGGEKRRSNEAKIVNKLLRWSKKPIPS